VIDRVLQALAWLLQEQHRGGDCIGRWGGEEFLVICPDSGLEAARILADRLRLAAQQHAFPVAGSITASFGVAAHQTGESASELLSRADAALYAAKAGGRNRVELAGSVVAEVRIHADGVRPLL